MTIIDKAWPNPAYAPRYEGEPSLDMKDALALPIIFHGGGIWDDARQAEWLRITGTREATTKVLCDHMRFVLAENPPAVTDSCGCVFCDVDLRPDRHAGVHHIRGKQIPCTNSSR